MVPASMIAISNVIIAANNDLVNLFIIPSLAGWLFDATGRESNPAHSLIQYRGSAIMSYCGVITLIFIR